MCEFNTKYCVQLNKVVLFSVLTIGISWSAYPNVTSRKLAMLRTTTYSVHKTEPTILLPNFHCMIHQ